jgi:hypothetical protein
VSTGEQQDPPIVIVEKPIDPDELSRLVHLFFGNMVKIVVDVRRQILAAGGDLNADAEELLMGHGSQQADLWGANYYPGRGEDCIEYTAMINIRPAQENPSMEIENPEIRTAVREITFQLLGQGENL